MFLTPPEAEQSFKTTIDELIRRCLNNNQKLVLGTFITTKLMEELKKSQNEFSEYANELDDYIKNQYIDCCCFKKCFCSS